MRVKKNYQLGHFMLIQFQILRTNGLELYNGRQLGKVPIRSLE